MTRIALLLSVGIFSSVAAAAEPVVSSSGNDVVVSIGGITTAGNHAIARGDQIEIPLLSRAGSTPRKFSFDDATIKRVEITDDTLIVTVHHSRESTILTAQQAHIDSSNNRVRIVMPRSPRHSPIENSEPVEAAPAKPIAVAAPAIPEPKAATNAPEPKAPEMVASNNNTAPALADITAPAPSSRGPWWMIAFGALALIGIVVARRRRPNADTTDMLRVVASRSLGGKSRLVLVEAKGKKLLLSVDERGTRLISQMAPDHNSDDDDASGNNDETFGEALGISRYADSDNHDGDAKAPVAKASPAVAGLLKLRQGKSAHNNDAGAGNGNGNWLAELAAATKRAGQKS